MLNRKNTALKADLTAEAVSYVSSQGKTILEQVTIGLSYGECLAVIGPNGAGKSSLLNVLAGGVAPSAGSVSLHGKSLKRWRPSALATRRAVLSQNIPMSFPLTALQIVKMGASYQTPDCGAVAAAHAALEAVSLSALAQQRYTQLSGGQQQRVQVARVLVQLGFPSVRPQQYVLLDEPTSALDISFQHQVLHLFQGLSRTHSLGVLLVLHDINLASSYADRVAIMQSGRLCQVLLASAVQDQELLGRVFQHPFDVMSAPPHAGGNKLSFSRALSV